jgi:type II secretory pathway pseudopilin PulG
VKKKNAFTLIELLVDIAVLMEILMPSLRGAKRNAAPVACLSNQRQLALAWMLYAQENDYLFYMRKGYNPGGLKL